MAINTFYKSLETLNSFLEKELKIKKIEGSEAIIVNGVTIDTNQQVSLFPIHPSERGDDPILNDFYHLFKVVNIIPTKPLEIPIITNTAFRTYTNSKDYLQQQALCVELAKTQYLATSDPKLNHLVNAKRIAIMVRGIDNKVESLKDVQGYAGRAGHFRLALVDKTASIFYLINDSVSIPEEAEVVQAQAHSFLAKLELPDDISSFKLELCDKKSRLQEEFDYISQSCNVSQFLSYCAVLNGVHPTQIKETIPSRVAVLIYLIGYYQENKKNNKLERRLRNILSRLTLAYIQKANNDLKALQKLTSANLEEFERLENVLISQENDTEALKKATEAMLKECIRLQNVLTSQESDDDIYYDAEGPTSDVASEMNKEIPATPDFLQDIKIRIEEIEKAQATADSISDVQALIDEIKNERVELYMIEIKLEYYLGDDKQKISEITTSHLKQADAILESLQKKLETLEKMSDYQTQLDPIKKANQALRQDSIPLESPIIVNTVNSESISSINDELFNTQKTSFTLKEVSWEFVGLGTIIIVGSVMSVALGGPLWIAILGVIVGLVAFALSTELGKNTNDEQIKPLYCEGEPSTTPEIRKRASMLFHKTNTPDPLNTYAVCNTAVQVF